MKKAQVDIICPCCQKKAMFYADGWAGSYVLYPSKQGIVKCSFCGVNKNFTFSNKDYWYQIKVGKRTLFARNIENLKALQYFFEHGLRAEEPDMDFPKEFYKNKVFIINSIQNILNQEDKI